MLWSNIFLALLSSVNHIILFCAAVKTAMPMDVFYVVVDVVGVVGLEELLYMSSPSAHILYCMVQKNKSKVLISNIFYFLILFYGFDN